MWQRKFSIIATCILFWAIAPIPMAQAETHSTAGDDVWARLEEDSLIFVEPIAKSEASNILANVVGSHPLELVFQSGDWTGGVILMTDTDNADRSLSDFLHNDPSAQNEDSLLKINGPSGVLTHIGAQTGGYLESTSRVDNRSAEPLPAARNFQPGDVLPPGSCRPNTDCSEWANPANGEEPGFPTNGFIRHTNMQGIYDVTTHTIHGLGNSGYPAIKRYVAYTQGAGGFFMPLYAYEHDYKLADNGYAQARPDYQWSTNLPGAYRDTRASDSGDSLDFTIGSLFTWMLDASKTYFITTYIPLTQGSSSIRRTTGKLVAEVLPNDGGRVPGAMGGCEFPFNSFTSDTPPALGGGVEWCAGIGGGLGSQTDHRVLVSLNGFPVALNMIHCRSWVLGNGFTYC